MMMMMMMMMITHNMWLVPRGPVVDQLGGKEDSKSDHLFGSVSHYVPPECFTGTSFFKISSGNMRRHVISGESLKPFDFLAQRYFPVDGDDTFVNLVPCGSPFAINFQGVDFSTLVENIFVWKLDTGIAFVHNILMNLACLALPYADMFLLVKFSWVRIPFLVVVAKRHKSFVTFVFLFLCSAPSDLRSRAASNLLMRLLTSGAVEGGKGHHFCDDTGDATVVELVRLGLISIEGDQLFTTKLASSKVRLAQQHHRPTNIISFSSGGLLSEDDMTMMDLYFSLLADGWKENRTNKKSHQRNLSYQQGGEKIFLYQAFLAPGKQYLLALWRSESLFAKGVVQIHHGQLESYYQSLLCCGPEQAKYIYPNQKMQEYKRIIKHDSTETTAGNLSVAELEDESILTCQLVDKFFFIASKYVRQIILVASCLPDCSLSTLVSRNEVL